MRKKWRRAKKGMQESLEMRRQGKEKAWMNNKKKTGKMREEGKGRKDDAEMKENEGIGQGKKKV